MYDSKKWLDEVKDTETGEIIQEGTDQSAGNFNNMEGGIADAHLAAALLLISAGLTADQVETETQTVSLSNSEHYPFNNSVKTVSLRKARNFTDYTVEAEVLDHKGCVGDVRIYERMLNGFKVSFDGSAKSATIKLRIKGGM